MHTQVSRVIFFFIFSMLYLSTSFALPSLPNQEDKQISLENLRGKYVVLEWLNFGCHMLKGHYKALHVQRAQKKLRDLGISWVSVLSQGKGEVSYFENKEALGEALRLNSWAGDYALRDAEGWWGRHFEAKKTPFHIVLDPVGKVIYRGALDDSNPFTHNEASVKKARNFLLMAIDDHKKKKKVKIPFSMSYGCPIRYAVKPLEIKNDN